MFDRVNISIALSQALWDNKLWFSLLDMIIKVDFVQYNWRCSENLQGIQYQIRNVTELHMIIVENLLEFFDSYGNKKNIKISILNR